MEEQIVKLEDVKIKAEPAREVPQPTKKQIAKEKRRKVFSFILKSSKIIVIATLLYTAFIMFQLGNPVVSLTITFGAAFFLILNKLESTWG